jgi:hypothetical protein
VSPRGAGLAIALLAAACQGPPQEALAPLEDSVAVRRIVESPVGPDTTGESILAWLREARYRETWDTWPDTSVLRPDSAGLPSDPAARASGAAAFVSDTLVGAEIAPHGALRTTYLNPIAVDALERGAHAMPAGAIAVIEEHFADSTLSAVSVMVQSEGYDPVNRDWVFAQFGSTGEIEAAGRVEACHGCHVLEPDYLFSAELGTPLPVDSGDVGPGGGPP